MKLGNISQTIVPIPKFFYDPTKKLDAFKAHYESKMKKKDIIKRSHSYFCHKHLLHSNLDINLSNNPRNNFNKFEYLNKEVYIPKYQKFNTINNNKLKGTYFPDIIKKNKFSYIPEKKRIFRSYLDYKKSTNINEILNKNLRDEIKDETNNLIEKINGDYDITKYSEFDSRTTFNKFFQTGYSSLTDVIKNSKSEQDIFKEVLKEKIYSLRTINSKTRESLKNNSFEKKLYTENYEDIKNPEKIRDKINNLLDNCQTNLLQLKYNNREPIQYNKKDQKFIEDNKFLTSRINRKILYKDFPSITRMEFAKKKIIIPKKLMKYISQNNFFTKEKYGLGKDELLNCQNNIWIRPLHKDAFKLHE